MSGYDVKSLSSGKGSMNKHLVNGMSSYQYFSPKQIIESLIENNDVLKLDKSKNILFQANLALDKHDDKAKLVRSIIYKFGLRLAEVLYLLDSPTEEQRRHRSEYTEEDWEYLKGIKRIYLAGGLLTTNFSKIFKLALMDYYGEHSFSKEVVFIENSSNFALDGLTTKTKEKSLLYDFGQTNVKRGLYNKKLLSIFDQVPVKINKGSTDIEYAQNTSQFIVKILHQDLIKNKDVKEIHMAISNYVVKGVIDPAPWHYGILHYFTPQYEQYLQDELSRITSRKISVKMHHDTTSMGYSIRDKKDSILISLGTAFGVNYFE